ncbi:MAG: hypothetical protein WD772_01055, partial [Pseudohongiellaceae bacterium]
EFADNNSANVLIFSYSITFLPVNDPNYDPFPEQIYIHDNSFTGGGTMPDNLSLTELQASIGTDIPDIVWDGVLAEGRSPQDALCLSNNGDANFANLDAANGFVSPSVDITAHQCSLPGLSPVQIYTGAE